MQPNSVADLPNATTPTVATLVTRCNDVRQQANVFGTGTLVTNGTHSPLLIPKTSLSLHLRVAGRIIGKRRALQRMAMNSVKIADENTEPGAVGRGKWAPAPVMAWTARGIEGSRVRRRHAR